MLPYSFGTEYGVVISLIRVHRTSGRHSLCVVCFGAQAQALGVPRGPLYAQLVRGQTVVLPGSGRTVVPADVVGASAEGPLAVVVDVPTAAHLPALLAHPALRRCLHPEGDPVLPALHRDEASA